MRKTVLVYGLVSGVLASTLMVANIPFLGSPGITGPLIGYTSFALSALLVFFGVRSYRQNAGNGRLTFGRGCAIGLLIALVSSACYVATWELLYFGLMPGLGDKVAACMVDRVRASGAGPDEVAQAERRAQSYKEMSDKPLLNVAITVAEPLPIGVVFALVSAAVLRRK